MWNINLIPSYVAMIAIVLIISMSIQVHNYHFFLVGGIDKFWSLSTLDYNTAAVYAH